MAGSDLFEIETSAGESKKITKTNAVKDLVDGTALATGAVTTAKIADGAVTADKVSAGAVVGIGVATFTTQLSGTATIPNDDTIPQISEGTEFMTLAYTPKSGTNILEIKVNMLLSNSNVPAVTAVALFQNSTSDAIAVASQTFTTTSYAPNQVTLVHTRVAGTTSSVTFRVRVGSHAGGTTSFNGISGGRMYGAIPKSSMTITEYKA